VPCRCSALSNGLPALKVLSCSAQVEARSGRCASNAKPGHHRQPGRTRGSLQIATVQPGVPCSLRAKTNAFSAAISSSFCRACHDGPRTRPHGEWCRASGRRADSGEPQAGGLHKRSLGEWPWLGWSGEHRPASPQWQRRKCRADSSPRQATRGAGSSGIEDWSAPPVTTDAACRGTAHADRAANPAATRTSKPERDPVAPGDQTVGMNPLHCSPRGAAAGRHGPAGCLQWPYRRTPAAGTDPPLACRTEKRQMKAWPWTRRRERRSDGTDPSGGLEQTLFLNPRVPGPTPRRSTGVRAAAHPIRNNRQDLDRWISCCKT
jgi:hypothetical protein